MKNDLTKKLFSRDFITILLIAIVYALVAFKLYTGELSRQITNMIIPISCYIVLAVSLNLVVGLLGELSLGHAGFMSVGLFSGCIVSIAISEFIPMTIALPLAVIIGGLFAAIFGLLVGIPVLRLRGDYLAIVTLACGEIIKDIITNMNITGGALGLSTLKIYSKPTELLPFAIILVFITVIVTMNLKHSRHGRAITAIRDNRIAAEASGINVTYYKLLVFVIAAFFAGMAGVLYGHSLANIKAATFDYNMSIEILVIVVLGGMGSVRGSVIAAIILKSLPEILRWILSIVSALLPKSINVGNFDFSKYRMLIYSVLLIAIMLLNASPKFAELKGRLSLKNLIAFLKKNKKQTAAAEGKEDR